MNKEEINKAFSNILDRIDNHISDSTISVIFDICIKSGLDVNYQDKNGYTFLHVAVMKSIFVLVEKLIQNNADVNATNIVGITPLDMFYIYYDYNKENDIVKIHDCLIKNGAKRSKELEEKK